MIFVNPSGLLCYTVILFGRPLFTVIDVVPRFDGHGIDGDIINENDWIYVKAP